MDTGLINTSILSNKKRSNRSTSKNRGTSTFRQKEAILIIRGIVEQIVVPENEYVVLGRTDYVNGVYADLDLSPYDSASQSISREHARIFTRENQLLIIDMNSTNGTYINGHKLLPNKPQMIRKGDNLHLGSLPVQILF